MTVLFLCFPYLSRLLIRLLKIINERWGFLVLNFIYIREFHSRSLPIFVSILLAWQLLRLIRPCFDSIPFEGLRQQTMKTLDDQNSFVVSLETSLIRISINQLWRVQLLHHSFSRRKCWKSSCVALRLSCGAI